MMSRSFTIWLTANAGAYEPSTTMARLYCSKEEATALSQMTSITQHCRAVPYDPWPGLASNADVPPTSDLRTSLR